MCGQKAEEPGGQGEGIKAESVISAPGARDGKGPSQVEGSAQQGLEVLGLRDSVATHTTPRWEKAHASECYGVPSTLKFQQ